MHRRPTLPARKRRAFTTTVAAVALTGTALVAPPAAAHEAEPTEVPPAPEPATPAETPPTAPPSLPVEPPVELPAVEVPITVPVPAVRSGYALQVPGAPATELPLAPDPEPPAAPAPRTAEPAVPPDEPLPPRPRPTRRRAAGEAPRAVPKTPPGARASSTTVAAAPPAPTQHTVVVGEHLWSIAASQVAAATGRAPESVSAVEVAPYWTQLCMLNEARLRSGDLNLVYAGEVLDLPAF